MPSTRTPPETPDSDASAAEKAQKAAAEEFDAVLGRPRDPDKLGDYLDRLFLFAARRRVALVMLAVLFGFALLAALISAWEWDPDPDLGSSPGQLSESDPSAFEAGQGSPAGDATPTLAADLGAGLNIPVVLRAGEGERADRIVVDPDPEILPQPPGDVRASLLAFGGTPHVAVIGPRGWLDEACIQLSTVTSDLRLIAASWHDTPTGACGAQGVGDQAEVRCVGARVIVLELEIPAGEVELPSGPDAPAAAVRVALRSVIDGYETAAVVANVPLPEEFDPTSLPAARAARGETVTITPAEGDGQAVRCQVQ